MSKDKISDYSATANSNTDIAGINIDEGCAPSGINNAIRTLMKQLKDWQSGSQDVYITPAGSVSAPAVTTTGDTNTGVYFPAADKVAITTGGTQAVIVDSSQNVGIGTNSPALKTEVRGAGGSPATSGTTPTGITAVSNGDTYGTLYTGAYTTSPYALWMQGASRAALGTYHDIALQPNGGNVGIGTSSPSGQLDISKTGDAVVSLTSAGVQRYQLIARSGGRFDFQDQSAGATRWSVDQSGNLLVAQSSLSITTLGASVQSNGYISSAVASSSNGNSNYNLYSTGAGAFRFYVGMGGTVYATSTTITGISDQRLKENIRDLDEGLDVVMALKPRKFDWKEGKGADIKNARGFIAQEFETVLPDMIEEWKDPAPEGEEPYKAVNANLIPTLVKAIQEQQAIITSLTARIEALEQA